MKKNENNNREFDDDFKIDDSQFDINSSESEQSNKLEETETVPIDEKIETIHFPWFIAIVMGVLMIAIIALVIVIKVIEG